MEWMASFLCFTATRENVSQTIVTPLQIFQIKKNAPTLLPNQVGECGGAANHDNSMLVNWRNNRISPQMIFIILANQIFAMISRYRVTLFRRYDDHPKWRGGEFIAVESFGRVQGAYFI
jgi:hypothetical protein